MSAYSDLFQETLSVCDIGCDQELRALGIREPRGLVQNGVVESPELAVEGHYLSPYLV